jgi:hypothetical protein
MLIPKEKPYLAGLNSYYLQIDKFVEHLQGEIGSGCLYCEAADLELLVYFDEQEIVCAITQNNGERAQISVNLEPVMQSLTKKSFQVTIYYLDPNSIFFWGQMPPFKRAKAKLKSTDITLPDIVYRLRQKKFSGFIDVDLQGHDDGAILFFHQGDRKGGSYSWGKGGLSPSDDDYNRLLGLLQTNIATYDIGHFKVKSAPAAESVQQKLPDEEKKPQYFSNLDTALEEFLEIFIQVTHKKLKVPPLVQLKQQFLDLMDEYPVLDPFNNYYELRDDGTVEFAANAPREKIAEAIVNCVWKAVEDLKLGKKFKVAIGKWAYRTALEERGIKVER